MNQSRRHLLKCAAAAVMTGGAVRAANVPRGERTPAPNDFGLLYDSTRCIGCQACMAACKRTQGLPPEDPSGRGLHDAPQDLSATTKTVIRKADGPDGPLFMKAQCMHCVQPACVSVCLAGALHKGLGGIVSYDVSRCVGCRYCQVACPFNVPKFEWEASAPRIVKCELCHDRVVEGGQPACTEACPREAVVFGGRDRLLREARRRIAAEPDRYIDHIYGEHEGGGTQVLMLSEVPFANLALPELDEQAVAGLAEHIQSSIYKGFVIPMAVYAVLAGSVWYHRRAAQGAKQPARPKPPPAAPKTPEDQLGQGGLA